MKSNNYIVIAILSWSFVGRPVSQKTSHTYRYIHLTPLKDEEQLKQGIKLPILWDDMLYHWATASPVSHLGRGTAVSWILNSELSIQFLLFHHKKIKRVARGKWPQSWTFPPSCWWYLISFSVNIAIKNKKACFPISKGKISGYVYGAISSAQLIGCLLCLHDATELHPMLTQMLRERGEATLIFTPLLLSSKA